MAGVVEAALEADGVVLPTPTAPQGSYVPFVKTGNLVYISGQVPMGPNGVEFVGRCGDDKSIEDGQAAAKLCAINILAQVKAAIGDLDKIVRVVKVNGYVNATPDFRDHPKVINGASDFLVKVLGEKGKHARAAVGVAGLPSGVAVEVEAIVEFAS